MEADISWRNGWDTISSSRFRRWFSFVARKSSLKQLAGVRADASVILYSDGRKLAEDKGEVQLTDYGISGIPVFQVSRFAARALDEGRDVRAVLNVFIQEYRNGDTPDITRAE
ncbi:MAG: hypothetical protein ACLTR6_05120 [Clostridium fessum]